MASRKKSSTLVLLRRGRRVVAAMTTEGHPTWGQLKALKAFSDGRPPLVWEEGPPCWFIRVNQLVNVSPDCFAVVVPKNFRQRSLQRNEHRLRFDQLSLFPDLDSSPPS